MTSPTIPASLRVDPALREELLSFYLETATGPELAEWLRDIGQDPSGTVSERRQRIRANTQYLTMPPEGFPEQTENYLAPLTAMHLSVLCEGLGLDASGNKDALYRRIMRTVHTAEGWVPKISHGDPSFVMVENVAHILAWFPITKRGEYEKDFYPVIFNELDEVFGSVYEQVAVAHGSTLKIDFHIGDPAGAGVGVEVKMPANNADVQRALGQIDQYMRRYERQLIVLVLNDLLKPDTQRFMLEELGRKGVAVVVR